jgi:hypothetical protein
VNRLVIVAPLRAGTHARAAALIQAGPPFDLRDSGLEEHAVYLSADEAIFVFEGAEAEYAVHDIVDDPVRSASFSAWAPLLAGRPRLAQEAFAWRRRQPF